MSLSAKWGRFSHASMRMYHLRTSLMLWARRIVGVLTGTSAASGQAMWNAYERECSRVMGGGIVLDLGCGPGDQRGEIIGWGAKEYFGADLSIGMIRNARGTSPESRFAVGDAAAIPFRDHSFDVVTSSFLFHHIPPAARVDAVREQMRVGSRVLVRDLHGFERGVRRWLYQAYASSFDGSEHRCSLSEWRRLFGEAGVEIEAEGMANPDSVIGRHCFFVLRNPVQISDRQSDGPKAIHDSNSAGVQSRG